MPFKSEKQRRYLWANEPEIARDWTDTYGSRVQAALGGIMALLQGGRAGYYKGGQSIPSDYTIEDALMATTQDKMGGITDTMKRADLFRQGDVGQMYMAQGGRIGFMGAGIAGGGKGDSHDRGGRAHMQTAQKAVTAADTRDRGDVKEKAIEKYSTKPYGLKTKGPLDKGFDLYKKYAPIPNIFRFAKKIFGTSPEDENPYSTGSFTMGNPHRQGPTGPTTGPDRGDGPYIAPQYIDDIYAQNVMEEDGLDIDTSTGNLQDWVQNFRLADTYRQHPGTIDKPIRYT
jgi:hypothetical protein